MIKTMSKANLQTQPYKGARDFYPQDMEIRNFIFNKWRKVCQRYGYEEYDGPFIEPFEIYAAKSGEELVNEQLYSFEDRAKRKVAIRPEMTPTVARMISQKFNEIPQPIRWFSIPNLWRYEKPQKGRLREHFQLNADVFGVEGVEADIEIISLLVDLLKEFGAEENMFEIRVNNRRFIDDVYKEIGISETAAKRVNKALDKKSKISLEDFEQLLLEDAKISKNEVQNLKEFLKSPNVFMTKMAKNSLGAQEILKLLELAKVMGIEKFVTYDPTVVRGLDYYTGNVFELYDLSPENPRAMAGGGRYDNLIEAFIGKKISGIGFGMGDVTFRNFLENRRLLPNIPTSCEYFVTTWPSETDKFYKTSAEVAKTLRNKNLNTQMWLETNTRLDKQLKYADKKGVLFALIIGENELKDGTITVKDLQKMTQKTLPLEKFINEIK